MKNYLFVYGTLRSGHKNPVAVFFHQQAQLVGQATMPGRLFSLGEYTAAVYEPAATEWVHGEVFQLMDTPLVFNVLDEYEGIGEQFPQPNEYIRSLCEVVCEGKSLKCWVYLLNRSERSWSNI